MQCLAKPVLRMSTTRLSMMTPPPVVVKEQCYTRKGRKVRCLSTRQSIPRVGRIPSGWHGQRGRHGWKGIPESTYQHAKHLGYQPPVARDSGPVFEQLFLRPLDVVHHVFSVDKKGQPTVVWVGRVGGQPGWTYVLASMRWIISDCSLTMPASCPKLWYMPISRGPRRERMPPCLH